MTFPKKLFKFPIFLLLVLLAFSPLAALPVHSQVVVHPYDWVQTGAYAKYFTPITPNIILPNGTRRNLVELYSPVLFDWIIVDKQGSSVTLNVTLFIHGWYYEADFKRVDITHQKTLLVDVDIYTRESFIDGESIGKTCFWADPYKEIDDNVTVFSDPDLLEANVWWVRTLEWPYVEKEFKMYGAHLDRCEPNATARGSYVFSWYTGVAIEPTLIASPWDVPPKQIGNFLGSCRNGPTYNVTRYAGTKLGTALGIGPHSDLTMDLNETNIDLTLETEPEPPQEPLNLIQYLPHAFIATFAITATTLIILRKKRQHKPT